ncbi:MAG: hypothetical protein GY732_22030, partial [Gammaproteobacteria bacterium]|nr:hypothetical protein [Gammaproteobacteria bacterium]
EYKNITIDVLANDTNPNESGTLTVSSFDTTGTLGSVTRNSDGTFSYDPNSRFDDLGVGESVTDTFVYTVSDDNGTTDTATVTITITGVKRSATGLIFNTPTSGSSFNDLFTDPQRSVTPWYQIWTGNEAGTEGSYVDTSQFHTPGNGWIEAGDLAGLFPDYCQVDDTAIWVRYWTQAGGFSAWAFSEMPFQIIDTVDASDSVAGPMPLDQMFNDENISSDHWYRIWVGDTAGEETSGSFMDTTSLNNGAGQGWVRASELATISFTPDEPGISRELWVKSWSPTAGNLGWEHWTVTCTQETTTAAVLEQNIDLTGTNETEFFAITDYVEPETHWQQIFTQTDETGTHTNENIGNAGFNEQIHTAANRFEAQREAFLERLS